MLAAQVAITAPLTDHTPLEHISVAIAITGFPEGAPAAHIAPTNIQRQHRSQAGLFHHRHIDGNVWTSREGFSLQAKEVEICTVLFQGRSAAAHYIRSQSLEFRQHCAGFEQEHATVPGEATRR